MELLSLEELKKELEIYENWDHIFKLRAKEVGFAYDNLKTCFEKEVPGHIGYYVIQIKNGYAIVPYGMYLTMQPLVAYDKLRKVTLADIKRMETYNGDDENVIQIIKKLADYAKMKMLVNAG